MVWSTIRLEIVRGSASTTVSVPRVGRAEVTGPEERIQQRRKWLIRSAEELLPGHQVVVRSVDRAQPEHGQLVRQQAREVRAGRVLLGDQDLLEDELEVRSDKRGHNTPP